MKTLTTFNYHNYFTDFKEITSIYLVVGGSWG